MNEGITFAFTNLHDANNFILAYKNFYHENKGYVKVYDVYSAFIDGVKIIVNVESRLERHAMLNSAAYGWETNPDKLHSYPSIYDHRFYVELPKPTIVDDNAKIAIRAKDFDELIKDKIAYEKIMDYVGNLRKGLH